MAASESSASLDELFKESAGDLARFFSRRHDMADMVPDLVQETFLQMTRSVQDGRPLKSARGYLFGIARHLSQAAWSKRPPRELQPLNEDTLNVPAPATDDRVTAARETIACLSPMQREILELRFTQNLSYQEIATALDIPLGTVRSRLHHAIAEVRHRLQSDNP